MQFRGMKPPRYFTVFESLANAIACQQVSLGSAIQLLTDSPLSTVNVSKRMESASTHSPSRLT
jgi:hypothetical protein